LLKGAPAAFILELPTYKLPQASQVARQVWTNTAEFVKKAGTTIFCLSVILWSMTYYPRLSAREEVNVRRVLVADAVADLGVGLTELGKPEEATQRGEFQADYDRLRADAMQKL